MTAPLSVAAERCILGAMMTTSTAAEEAAKHLATSDFHDYRNGRIYDELLELWAAGEPTSPVYLLKRLSERGELTRSDTGPHLSDIYAEACSADQIGHYAGIVLDEANRRGLLLASAELAQAATLTDPTARTEKTTQILAAASERAAATAGPGTTQVVLTKASAYTMKGVRWLYRGRIPAGMVTLLAGREGIGKSTVALDIAGRLTRGTLPGRYEGQPQTVAVIATEDSWEHTILPRLKAVGADLDMVYNTTMRQDGRARDVVAGLDMPALEKRFQVIRPALMIIDPLMSILNGKVDSHKQAEVQRELTPLVAMCDRIGMAVLALIHVNKSTGSGDALNSVMGSKAFTTLPRSVLYCIEEEDGQFMLAHAKCNVGPKMPAIGYSLTSVVYELDNAEPGDEDVIHTSRIVWGVEDARTADQILTDKTALVQGGNVGTCRRDVLAELEGIAGVVTKQQLRDKLGDDYDDKALTNALLRLTKEGTVVKVGHGLYQAAKFSPKFSPSLETL